MNALGLVVTPSNPSSNNVKFEITGPSFGTVTHTTGALVKGEPTINSPASTADIITSFQSIDVSAYGVTGNGATDDTAAFQAAANAIPTSGGTLVVPASFTPLISSTILLKPATRILCSGLTGWGSSPSAESVVFLTSSPIVVFQIGTIGASSVQNVGDEIENCTFRDTTGTTALGAINVVNASRSIFKRVNFEGFGRAKVTTPSAPTVSATGSGTAYWVKISCINDGMGETVAGAEATIGNGGTTLTVTAPTSAGCVAPSSGYRVWATTTGTGVEVLQAATGCTLNASGTGCALTSNWVGTVSNSGNALLAYDTSAGYGAHTDANGGANGTLTDASYNDWEQIYCRTTSECLQFNGGSQFVHGGGELTATVYDILNQNNGFVSFVGGPSMEATNNSGFRMVIASSSSPTSVVGSKFEGSVVPPNNITCVETNTSRNSFLGDAWTKCNVLVQENTGSNDNHYDFLNQVSTGTTHYTGTKVTDTIDDNNTNGGGGSQVSSLALGSYPVASLPTGALTGAIATVIDGTSASDCTTGGSSSLVLCRYSGSVWASIGGGGGGGSPGGSTFASQYNAGGGTFGGVNSPSTNGVYNVIYNVTGSAPLAPSVSLGGVPVNTQSSATPSITQANDVQMVQTTNSTTSTATAIPAGSTLSASFAYVLCNTGTVVNTVTPTTSTINGNATIVLQGKPSGGNPSCYGSFMDSSNNYWAWESLPTDANGRLAAAGFPALTGDVTNSSGSLATTVSAINNTAFAGTSGHLVSFGAANIPADSGVVAANVVTQASNATTNQICTYTGANKICVPGIANIAMGGTAATSAAAGQVPNSSSTTAAAWTSAVTLGASGTLGSVTMGNATSGLLTLQPATGGLGTVTVSIPAATDTLVNLAGTQTLTNKSISLAQIIPALLLAAGLRNEHDGNLDDCGAHVERATERRWRRSMPDQFQRHRQRHDRNHNGRRRLCRPSFCRQRYDCWIL